jgi:hypothetical protein
VRPEATAVAHRPEADAVGAFPFIKLVAGAQGAEREIIVVTK